jgi:NhaP-type Na+/H+ or K+/H+ antiporter
MANFISISEFLLFGFAAIFALGIIAHWLAWKFKLPALLLLLIFGFLAGPATHILEPDVLFGELLAPVVTLSVGMMLFIAGFELHLNEFERYRNTLLRLLIVGTATALVLGAVLAKSTLGLPFSLAALLSAICLLSGPSVVLPLLRETPLKGSLGSVVRWEGALLEVIGTVLALLIFEVTYGLTVSTSMFMAFWNILLTIVVGGGIGILTAAVIILTARSSYFPDSLKGGISIGILLSGYALSFKFVPESGLLAALTAGIILGNQSWVSLQRYFEFGDTLRIPLYSALFVILAARISMEGLSEISGGAILFNLGLIFLVRPVSIFVSTFRSELTFKEKLFLSFFAPRGAVAAAIASLFALDLLDVGFPQA